METTNNPITNVNNKELTIKQMFELIDKQKRQLIIEIIKTNHSLYLDVGNTRYDIGDMFKKEFPRALDLINECEHNGWSHYNSLTYKYQNNLYRTYFLRKTPKELFF